MRLSNRLKESAACLVAGEGEMSAHMERLMQRLGRGEEVGEAKRVLELNGEHPAVVALRELYEKTPDDPRVEQLRAAVLRSGRHRGRLEGQGPDGVCATHQ